ncbi:hypothetical protein C4D60_Mb04t39430 [Musa balbisiana]|uniref:Uncharacterized protein n=1 Tax=Musa balbisiana TaxID=52838 RepID=A0A4S8KI67_MUSBA|nr:hypothetical protein C4D60_Mb04t39430 [Musa balbisiana]
MTNPIDFIILKPEIFQDINPTANVKWVFHQCQRHFFQNPGHSLIIKAQFLHDLHTAVEIIRLNSEFCRLLKCSPDK